MTTEHAFHAEQLNEQEWPEYAAAMQAETDGPDLNNDDLHDTEGS